ncbi:MAG: putative Ig domain-containing protein [Candidatus Euphemobacter frigidus]|nr:putative Ig domain-containing protein [Candidatus Euphemobacter frigidus]MDP8276736.1 putative Ig domain-containing protein [Candidatus Euphemobacter frigidus]
MKAKLIRLAILVIGCVLLAAGLRLLYLRYYPDSSPRTSPLSVRITRTSGDQGRLGALGDGGMKAGNVGQSSGDKEGSFVAQVATPPSSILSITTAKLPMGAVGDSYRQILKTSAPAGKAIWKLAAGSLPPGLSLGQDGVLSGLPGKEGEWRFTVLVEDEKGGSARKEFRLLIRPSAGEKEEGALALLATPLSDGFLGREYLQKIEWEGGEPPYEWALSGALLPELIHLNKQTGVLYGTPREIGKFQFTIRLTDGAGKFVERNYTLLIQEGTIEIITAALPPAAKGEKYSLTFRARGGVIPYRWEVVTGSLPLGLVLDPERGILSGIPGKWETTTFLLRVTGSEGRSAEKEFNLEVTTDYYRRMIYQGLRIITASLPQAVRGELYNGQFEAAGGTPPYIWTISRGDLPPSLSLESETGQINGIPEEAGKTVFTVLVSDSKRYTAEGEFSLIVNYQLVYITTGSLEVAVVGEEYQQPIEATGGTPPYIFSMESGSLPNGLSLNGAAGLIEGIVSDIYFGQGTREFIFRVKVIDQSGYYDIAELRLTVRETAEPTPITSPTPGLLTSPTPVPTISPVGLHISTDSLPGGKVGVHYDKTLTAQGGVAPYAWSMSSLPPGLSGLSVGTISGVPETAGEYSVSVNVTDAENSTASKTLPLSITEIQVDGVSELISASGDEKAGLAWTNPEGSEFRNVRVLRKTGDYPWNAGDGEIVYEGTGDNIVNAGLTNGNTYFYAVITYNQDGYPSELNETNLISASPKAVTLFGPNDPFADKVVGYYPLSSSGFGPTWVIGDTFDDNKENMVALQIGSSDSPDGSYIAIADGTKGRMEPGPCAAGEEGQYCLQGLGGMIDGNFIEVSEHDGKPVYRNSISTYYLYWSSYFDEDTYKTSRALGAPKGQGDYQGSYDVLSLQAKVEDGKPPCGGSIIIKFTDNIVVDGEGPDFTIFENVFYIGGSEQKRFMEPAIVYVSQNGVSYYRFPCNYVPHYDSQGDINYFNPYSYSCGFAGVNPVFSNNGSPDPTNPSVSGGDFFDLDDIMGKDLTWIQYVKIKATGDNWLTDDDGDKIRHNQESGACSGIGSSGFDLDAVSAVNY